MGFLTVPASPPSMGAGTNDGTDAAAEAVTTGGGGGTMNQSLFLTPANLTFPGVAVVAGVILNFFNANLGGSRFLVALGVALVFGVILTVVAFTEGDNIVKLSPVKTILALFIGLVNTALLWITIFGVSSIPAP